MIKTCFNIVVTLVKNLMIKAINDQQGEQK